MCGSLQQADTQGEPKFNFVGTKDEDNSLSNKCFFPFSLTLTLLLTFFALATEINRIVAIQRRNSVSRCLLMSSYINCITSSNHKNTNIGQC